MHQTTFTAPKAMAEALLALTETYPAISLDIGCADYGDAEFTYTLWLPLALQPEAERIAGQPLTYTPVDATIDYVAQTKALFPPLIIGPYFVARNNEPTPAGHIGLYISPNRAFGSGEHATTTGCLLAYEWLLAQGHSYTSGLDFGAGSGILAIAAAKRQGTPFLALDNDAPSVEICAENASLNNVPALIDSQLGEVPPQTLSSSPHDLIFANILLQPLLELAQGLAGALAPAPHAALILSGFTTEQAPEITAGYSALGLKCTWQHTHADWVAQAWQRA